jgi:hypothetical protein
MVSTEDLRILGAKKLLVEGLGIEKDESLLIYSDERLVPVAKYTVRAAKALGIEDTILMVNPDDLRPRRNAPSPLLKAIEGSNAMLYFFDRIPEETTPGTILPYRRELNEALEGNNVRNIGLYDPKPWYFDRGGIWADYAIVDEKGRAIVEALSDCQMVEITSEAGTQVSFEINVEEEIQGHRGPRYRGPSVKLTQREYPNKLGVQAPEAEGGCPPLMNTVNGRIAIDGAITGLGVPPLPVVLTFENGKIKNVEGDSFFLEEMKNFIGKLLGERPETLLCLDHIDEFSIGFNDWAVLDDNISNCEKVAGTCHFGIGHGSMSEGPGHGEYFDFMMNQPTIIITREDDTKYKLIDEGKLLV